MFFETWDEVPLHVYVHNNMTVERRVGPITEESEFPPVLEGTY
ncbi:MULTISPECIES: hypothetical protein [Streptomyces]|nr:MULTISPECIES: hypothetical protein [unclassified Streptomyces]MCY0923650.1 hypothetical protein [Streptomyces sp. H27-G5]MCY0945353.1 hypothetical protein [Streptomyces sp. H34-AA3]